MTAPPADPGSQWRRLFELPRHGTGVALPRLVEICRPTLEGAWLARTLSLHVTGSNGKGSVSTLAAGILGALGPRTGLFTSPHLLAPNERIRVSGRPVEDAEIAPAVERFFAQRAAYLAAHPDQETGSFEALTTVALDVFERAEVEAVVWEAGLGGRLDPTRLARGRTVALTSLDLEHTALLGDSLERIAYEKADLCPDGGVLVVGPISTEIEPNLAAWCRLRDVRTLFVEHAARVTNLRPRDGGEPGSRFDLALAGSEALRDLEIALPGAHQTWNAAVAVALVATALREAGRAPAPEALADAVRTGLARARVPGRFERIHRSPDVYIDIGHTPSAAQTTAQTLAGLRGQRRQQDRGVVLVLGVSDEKKVEEVVAALTTTLDPTHDRILCTRSHWHGAEVERIRRAVGTGGWTGQVATFEQSAEAIRAATEDAQPTGKTVLIAGSLFLAAEATCVLNDRDPAGLRFF